LVEYTMQMFQMDYEMVIPLFYKYRDIASLDNEEVDTGSQNAFKEIVDIFLLRYGNIKGADYQMRFLSIMQFIEHYEKDLLKDRIITEPTKMTTQIPEKLLNLLLDSFKPPQPPSPFPSSSLHNSYHEFNYKKVLKVYRASNSLS
jgi:hypothetical protein